MSANDSMSSVWDESDEAFIIEGTMTRGENDALGQLLQSFRAYLMTVAGREMTIALRGKCGASDVVQETFREAHRDRTAFRGKTRHELRAWLKRILLNNIRDFTKGFRQTKRQARLEVPMGPETLNALIDPELTPRGRACHREDTVVIARAIAGLPEDYRRVIELKSRENWTFQEIGQEMGRSPDAARMLWFRAIESLRRELAASDGT
jgi:RNA polymerase sigma-70 factor (ECF subfamily)